MIGIKIKWIVYYIYILEYGGGFGGQDEDSDDDDEKP